MIPLPQTPWTLAIADLMGMHAAAQGSGTQPADLLASVLPNRQPPPEGWLENFLAGTPVPGLASTAGIPSTVNGIAGPIDLSKPPTTSPSDPPTSGSNGTPPPTGQETMKKQMAVLWERTLKCIAKAGESGGDNQAIEPSSQQPPFGIGSLPGIAGPVSLPGASGPVPAGRFPPLPTMGNPNPESCGCADGVAPKSMPGPGIQSFHAGHGSCSAPSPSLQIGDDLQVQINLTLDSRKFFDELHKLVKEAAEQVVGRHQARMGAQDRAGCWGRR